MPCPANIRAISLAVFGTEKAIEGQGNFLPYLYGAGFTYEPLAATRLRHSNWPWYNPLWLEIHSLVIPSAAISVDRLLWSNAISMTLGFQ
jgi:hypothetical protein